MGGVEKWLMGGFERMKDEFYVLNEYTLLEINQSSK
jgi:hypothetical protein